MCLSVSVLVRNRLPYHAYYSDEAFAGDSVGLELGQRLNYIFKKLILMYFWGKIAPYEKILFEQVSKSSLILIMKEIKVTNLTPLVHNC